MVTFLPLFAPSQFDSRSFTWQLIGFGKLYHIYNMSHRLIVLQRCEIHL